MGYEMETVVYGGSVTGYEEDDVIEATIEYYVEVERETRDYPGCVTVCDIVCSDIRRTDGLNIQPEWQNRFEEWAENNADRLIEAAQYEMESRWEARRSVDYDAWRDRKMDGVI